VWDFEETAMEADGVDASTEVPGGVFVGTLAQDLFFPCDPGTNSRIWQRKVENVAVMANGVH
jgi:hypothetical protein